MYQILYRPTINDYTDDNYTTVNQNEFKETPSVTPRETTSIETTSIETPLKKIELPVIPAVSTKPATIFTGKGFEQFKEAYAKSGVDQKYFDFFADLAKGESGFNPEIRNKAGAPAYGYFQFMEDGKKWKNIQKYAGTDIESFKNNPVLQIQAAKRLADSFLKSIPESTKKKARELGYTDSALIAGAWLGGAGGVKNFIEKGINASDKHWSSTGAGTDVATVMKKRNGYFKEGGTIPINQSGGTLANKVIGGGLINYALDKVAPQTQRSAKIRKAIDIAEDAAVMLLPELKMAPVVKAGLEFARLARGTRIGGDIGGVIDKQLNTKNPYFRDAGSFIGGVATGRLGMNAMNKFMTNKTAQVLLGGAAGAQALKTAYNWRDLNTYEKARESLYSVLGLPLLGRGINMATNTFESTMINNSLGRKIFGDRTFGIQAELTDTEVNKIYDQLCNTEDQEILNKLKYRIKSQKGKGEQALVSKFKKDYLEEHNLTSYKKIPKSEITEFKKKAKTIMDEVFPENLTESDIKNILKRNGAELRKDGLWFKDAYTGKMNHFDDKTHVDHRNSKYGISNNKLKDYRELGDLDNFDIINWRTNQLKSEMTPEGFYNTINEYDRLMHYNTASPKLRKRLYDDPIIATTAGLYEDDEDFNEE